MRRTSLLVVGLSLVACGDDAPGKGAVPGAPPTSPFDLAKGGKPLTPEELAQARRMGTDGDRARKELTETLQARFGPMLVEDAKKAQAFAERPLTAADVETYLALAPQLRTAAGTQGAAAALLAQRGLSGMEWGVLSGRIMALRTALQAPPAALDAKTAADVETLRPFADRLGSPNR